MFGCYYGVYLKLRIVNIHISIKTDTVKEKLFELETLPSTLYIHENGTPGPSAVISTRTLLLSSQALSYPLFLQLSDSWETRLSQAFWFYPDRRKLVSTSTTSTNNSTTKLLPSQEPFLPQLDTPTHIPKTTGIRDPKNTRRDHDYGHDYGHNHADYSIQYIVWYT